MTVHTKNPSHAPDWPRWCRAILRDARGRYVFERRPPDAKHVPGILNCFGGTREPGEHPEARLRRELLEELGYAVGAVELCVVLTTPTGVGWYYRVPEPGPSEGEPCTLEPGFGIEWIEPTTSSALASARGISLPSAPGSGVIAPLAPTDRPSPSLRSLVMSGVHADPSHWPRWCCAILRDARGRFLFERRPANEVDAPGMLTCFGGGREPGEDPETCLRRELVEELGFTAGELELVVALTTPKGVAWFYRGAGPEEGAAAALEPGYTAEWIAPDALDHAGVGGWNLAAIHAELKGEREAQSD